jgi:hydroxyethylthiazole kinase
MTEPRPSNADAGRVAACLERLRRERPLVQNITNYVSMDIAANALLALGASPAMVHAVEEIEDFGALIGALVVNIGTLSPGWVAGMDAAAAQAHRLGKPWVLDPVGAGATRFRNETVVRLAAHRPTVIRGNASEIMAVAAALGLGAAGSRPKGVDSVDTTDGAEAMAVALARHLDCVVAATGAIDLVTDGRTLRRLANGSPLMTQVTAVGCSLSAIAAAFCAVEPDALEATTAALAVVAIAGEIAADIAPLPGSFRTAWLDQLAAIDGAAVAARLRLG